MIRVFKAEWKRAISLSFFVSIAGVIFCLCFDSWNELLNAMISGNPHYSVYYFMSNSAYGGMCRNYILPIFSAIPFSTSLCEERRDKAVAYISSKEGRLTYSVVKYMVCIIIGGLTVALGTALFILILRARLGIVDVSATFTYTDRADIFNKWIAVYKPVTYCLVEIILGFMRGMIWGGIALFLSIYVADGLVVVMFPFLGSYALTRVEKLLNIDDNYRITYILTGRSVLGNSVRSVMIAGIVSVLLVVALGILYVKRMIKGLRDGTIY